MNMKLPRMGYSFHCWIKTFYLIVSLFYQTTDHFLFERKQWQISPLISAGVSWEKGRGSGAMTRVASLLKTSPNTARRGPLLWVWSRKLAGLWHHTGDWHEVWPHGEAPPPPSSPRHLVQSSPNPPEDAGRASGEALAQFVPPGEQSQNQDDHELHTKTINQINQSTFIYLKC